ncbi:MAG TPA: potassium-transporting ATPase subunit F [Jatrophihabitans sp.]|nr:potassium-transporting ATPase subunit F [Jatrophihabitans sp.]
MSPENVVGLILSIAFLAYLVVALVCAEKF